MKILQVSSFMPPHQGGLELVVQNLFNGLKERNHDLKWIASSTPLKPGVDDNYYRISAFSSLEKYVHVPLPIWGLSGYRQLYSLCKWADVIHVHDCLYPSTLFAVLFSNILKRPLVVTQHIASVPYGRILSFIQNLAYKTLGRFVLQSASAITTYSAHVPPFFSEMGLKQYFEIIALGFDDRFSVNVRLRKHELRRKYGVETAAPLILYAGRLVPKKGIHTIIAVQEQLARYGYPLVIVGNGALAPLIKAVPSIFHIPYIPYTDMHEIYGMADVLFLPSHGEGLPLTLQEAMLCGLLAVVSNDPSYVKNVADAPGIFICDGEESYVKALLKSLSDTISSKTIACWAKLHFSKLNFLDKYEALYNRLRQ